MPGRTPSHNLRTPLSWPTWLALAAVGHAGLFALSPALQLRVAPATDSQLVWLMSDAGPGSDRAAPGNPSKHNDDDREEPAGKARATKATARRLVRRVKRAPEPTTPSSDDARLAVLVASAPVAPEPPAPATTAEDGGFAHLVAHLAAHADAADDSSVADSGPGARRGEDAAGTGRRGAGRGAGVGRGIGTGAGHGIARAPRLVAAGNPCASYFPAAARARHGQVRIRLRVDAAGHADIDRVLNEAPRGQGFGPAARACIDRLRFDPARDPAGLATAGIATLALHFDRT